MKKRPSREYIDNKTWEEKAKENPLYGVMSEERFAESSGEPSKEEFEQFYARGREMVAKWIAPWVQETSATDEMKILEFGCGMGRLTNALADYHPAEKIAGIDISKTMVSHAKAQTPAGIHYEIVSDDGTFPFESESFSRVYSYAVFQHIAQKSVVEKSIEEISRVLAPGGFVKLNFEMVFVPPFENTFSQDTCALERQYLVHGFKKIHGIPLWGVKLNKSTNWSGIRLGYKQLIRKFRSVGIDIYGIHREPGSKGMIWFYGCKREQ